MTCYPKRFVPSEYALSQDVEEFSQMYNIFEENAYFLGKILPNQPIFSVTMSSPNTMSIAPVNDNSLRFAFSNYDQLNDLRKTEGFLEVVIKERTFRIQEPQKQDFLLQPYREGLKKI